MGGGNFRSFAATSRVVRFPYVFLLVFWFFCQTSLLKIEALPAPSFYFPPSTSFDFGGRLIWSFCFRQVALFLNRQYRRWVPGWWVTLLFSFRFLDAFSRCTCPRSSRRFCCTCLSCGFGVSSGCGLCTLVHCKIRILWIFRSGRFCRFYRWAIWWACPPRSSPLTSFSSGRYPQEARAPFY